MKRRYAKESIAVAWVFTLFVIGIAGQFTSISAWAELAAIAFVPVAIGSRLWRESTPTMSESIQRARG